jgi:hypothetical protein
MKSAEAKRLKVEWFYGIEMFLESEEGEFFLDKILGISKRDEVDHKILLLLIEAELPLAQAVWDEEQELCTWRSMQRSSSRRLFIDSKLARDDVWDQRAFEKRYNELYQTAQDVVQQIQRFIENRKAELEKELVHERQTPIMQAPDEIIELSKPSDMITLQCENDPDAMERVKRYLEEIGSDPELSPILEAHGEFVANEERPRTIYPPPSVPPEGGTEAGVCIPKSDVPSIIPKKDGDDGPDISVSFTSLEED